MAKRITRAEPPASETLHTVVVSAGRNLGNVPTTRDGYAGSPADFEEWHQLCDFIEATAIDYGQAVYFVGTGNALNAWSRRAEETVTAIFSVRAGELDDLRNLLARVAAEFHQEAIALSIVDSTEFHGPRADLWS